jgi:hypothetical protein
MLGCEGATMVGIIISSSSALCLCYGGCQLNQGIGTEGTFNRSKRSSSTRRRMLLLLLLLLMQIGGWGCMRSSTLLLLLLAMMMLLLLLLGSSVPTAASVVQACRVVSIRGGIRSIRSDCGHSHSQRHVSSSSSSVQPQ